MNPVLLEDVMVVMVVIFAAAIVALVTEGLVGDVNDTDLVVGAVGVLKEKLDFAVLKLELN